MQLTSDSPFWSLRNGIPLTVPALDHDVKCEVVVVGAGITGALVAFHLVEAGVTTLLVEKRDIGTGSTSSSTGLLQYEVDVPLCRLISRIGRKKAMRSYYLCGEAVTNLRHLVGRLRIACDHAGRPSLFLAREPRDKAWMREEARLRREAGFDVQFWEERELQQRFGFSRPAALFSELGGEVDPHRLTHGLVKAAMRRGLQVCDRTRVVRCETTSRGIRLTTERGPVVAARRAVIAAGFESMPYLDGEAGTLTSTYALISEPVERFPHWHRRSLIWEAGNPYLYLRTTADRRIIVGGEDVDLVNPRRRDALLPRKTAVLLRRFRALFPDIPLEVAYSWAGTFAGTKDGLAYIGSTAGMPHAYFALGYGGNGITYSLIAAEIIRDQVLGRNNPDARLFRFGR